MAPLSRYKKFFFLLTCVFPLVYFIVFGAATSSQVAINSYDKQIPAPTLLSASKTTTGIKIEWKPVADADGYSIYRKASNEDKFTYLRVVSASATSYLDASVPVNSVYSYQICAFQYNGIGGRIFGPFGNVKTAGFILHTDFTSVTKHPAGIQLTWSATPNADGYSIYRKAANESSFSYLKMVSSTSFLDTTVSDNTVYSYKICAYRMYNGVRYFGYFGKIQSTAHVQTPELNSPTRTSSGIMIRWNAMENISGYSIYRKSSTDSSFSYLKMVSSAETAFLDSTVKNNTVYSYKICAYVYHNGGRLFGYFSPAKQSEVIASPTISSITKTPSGLKLCWEKIPGASGYSIYRKALAEDDFVYLKMVSNTDSFVDTTADPDTIYSYKICCYYYNEAGTRKFGNFSSVQSGGGILGQEYHFITFIDDDGYNTFYEKLLPLIEEYGISISTAIETDNVGTHNFMSWETIKKCYQAGAEILNHTKEHYVTVEEVQNLTREEIKESFLIAKSVLQEHGYETGNILVYSGATASVTWSIAKEVFRCGINSSGNVVNTPPFNLFNLKRYRVGSTHTPDFEELKSYIDEVVEVNGWEIWMMHSSNGYMTDEYIEALKQTIEYCETVGVKIISVSEALDYFNIP